MQHAMKRLRLKCDETVLEMGEQNYSFPTSVILKNGWSGETKSVSCGNLIYLQDGNDAARNMLFLKILLENKKFYFTREMSV